MKIDGLQLPKSSFLSMEKDTGIIIDKMFKNKLIIIPGFTVRMGIFFSRFIPKKMLLRISYNIQKKKG